MFVFADTLSVALVHTEPNVEQMAIFNFDGSVECIIFIGNNKNGLTESRAQHHGHNYDDIHCGP